MGLHKTNTHRHYTTTKKLIRISDEKKLIIKCEGNDDDGGILCCSSRHMTTSKIHMNCLSVDKHEQLLWLMAGFAVDRKTFSQL